MQESALFEKYSSLIRKRAQEYSIRYGVDYEELESQGFLIYCECLQKYDFTKSKFSTYLYIQLNRLADYVRAYKRQQGVLIQDYFNNEDNNLNYENVIPSPKDKPSTEEFLEEAKLHLSSKAYDLLEWIISGEWVCDNKTKPTIGMASKHFNKSRFLMEKIWNELKDFWNNEGCLFYA